MKNEDTSYFHYSQIRLHNIPFSISWVKCAIHTGTLEARMTVQVTRMARRVMGTVLRDMEDTGNTTAMNLDRVETIYHLLRKKKES